MRKLLFVAIPASAILTGLLVAQAPAPPEIDTPIFRSDVVNVQVPVTVRDSRGNFVNGLAPVDFQLLDEGIPQPVKLDVAAHQVGCQRVDPRLRFSQYWTPAPGPTTVFANVTQEVNVLILLLMSALLLFAGRQISITNLGMPPLL